MIAMGTPTNGLSPLHDVRGKFARGNPGGPGPGAIISRRMQRWRCAMLRCVTPEDFDAIAAKLIDLAKAGDIHAIHEFFDRVCGKAQKFDLPPVRVSGDVLIDARQLVLDQVRPEVAGTFNRWLEAGR